MYAKDQDKWFEECVFYSTSHPIWSCSNIAVCSFSKAVSTLFELGVPRQQFVTSEPWIMGGEE